MDRAHHGHAVCTCWSAERDVHFFGVPHRLIPARSGDAPPVTCCMISIATDGFRAQRSSEAGPCKSSVMGAVVESFCSDKRTRQLFGQTYRATKEISIAASEFNLWVCHKRVTILSHRFRLEIRTNIRLRAPIMAFSRAGPNGPNHGT
jgi:hypothetical protein